MKDEPPAGFMVRVEARLREQGVSKDDPDYQTKRMLASLDEPWGYPDGYPDRRCEPPCIEDHLNRWTGPFVNPETGQEYWPGEVGDSYLGRNLDQETEGGPTDMPSPAAEEEHSGVSAQEEVVPAIERLDEETSPLLKWFSYATEWDTHRPRDDELSVDEIRTITEEIEYEAIDQIEREYEVLASKDWYDLLEIEDEALNSVGYSIFRQMPLSRSVRTIRTEVLPWDHEKLCGRDEQGVFSQAEGLCERYDESDGVGFTITLASSATPTTVLHEIAHVLAFVDGGASPHGPRWLMYFLILMAGRYWELDVAKFMADLHDQSRPSAS